jgi:hypothetical protein
MTTAARHGLGPPIAGSRDHQITRFPLNQVRVPITAMSRDHVAIPAMKQGGTPISTRILKNLHLGTPELIRFLRCT